MTVLAARTGTRAPLAVFVGCLALAARVPSFWAVVVTAAVGVVGAIARVEREEQKGRLPFVLAVLAGSVPFAIANSWLRPSFAQTGVVVILASLVAALAEEIFFRRLVYGWLARWGAGVAIVGAGALFALVHLPAYGLTTLPLNFAAGVIFGWQRWSTGSWKAPAATHAIANLLGAF